MVYNELFQRGRIGKLTIKNRTVMPAMGTSLAEPTGEPSEEMIKYYEERAKNGCGLIITEITRVDEDYGVGTANQLSATSPQHIPGLEKLARRVQIHDSKLFVQLHHPGRQGHARLIGDKQIIAPSELECQVTKEKPRAMTTEEAEGLVKKFVKGAVISQKAGVDGVEIHGAHGYLINQFLSPYTNRRTDKYGGNFENRMRFLTEIIVGIKYMCGNDFPISVRLSADEFNPKGIDLQEGTKIAKYLESIGVDAINVSCGSYETGTTIIEPNAFQQGWKKHLAAKIRLKLNIPVIAVNNIKEPQIAEQMLSDQVCDFVGLGRSQLADPQWIYKAYQGKDEMIRPCISCLYCIEQLMGGRKFKCSVNPYLGREQEFSQLTVDGQGDTVAIIGGGPAGMVAAETLALRGFTPVIFEKEQELGGTLLTADKTPHKEQITRYVKYMEKRLTELNVKLNLGQEATVDTIKALSPKAVFVAAGANPIVPKDISGIDKDHVYTVFDVLKGEVELTNQHVAVIGSGLTGLETAELLGQQGNKISVVEMAKEIGPSVYRNILADITGRLKHYDVNYMPLQQLKKVTDNSIITLDRQKSTLAELEVDAVVLALGVTPNTKLAEEFYQSFENCYYIGDIVEAARIPEAVRDGLEKGSIL
ncbi:NAD(P)/FAD-dependent oxidoreductase [Natranaerobius thermophilus]|uniref:NADH:flavin oxidoreductase/NADH oxidase n=1 Tax=Natranaerobius thermophilus (strain ATCC BAA-1301 / DSM 18059 / JW/NM-WN-LF) TaxID=457570 RepID=B2A0W4_NATTJ|nr:NAD(P)/FAD-dependent oxidoreductase [Natranaerobius thermophilus]ACB85994.1 NADH:flavin oxidoreductase/NADH oxidase [Natranaerobius thermophilus JW/NM-WN-LF]